ncbi:ATP/GTP-binding protein, partial [Rhodococcus sp. CX]|nr:ATP/GTP-binding protein [Rhodococcus sp. CX]
MSGGTFTQVRGTCHFRHLDPATRDTLFLHHPQPFDDSDDRERLALALGATLYVPATRPDL